MLPTGLTINFCGASPKRPRTRLTWSSACGLEAELTKSHFRYLHEDADQPKDKVPKLPMLPSHIEAISDLTQSALLIKLESMSSSEIVGWGDIVLRYRASTFQELDPVNSSY